MENAPVQQQAQPQQTKGTNGFAIAALITGLLGLNVLAIIFGFVALSQIKTSGEGGKGMAIAGIVLGFAAIVIFLIIFLSIFVFVGAVSQTVVNDAETLNAIFEGLNNVNASGSFNFSQ